MTGPSPVDRGKPGSKIHVLSERQGLPLSVGISAANLRTWVAEQDISVRIARKGIETSEKLGRHRRVIERTIAWLTGYRRLIQRYERKACDRTKSQPAQVGWIFPVASAVPLGFSR